AIAVILDPADELDAARLQLRDRALDVARVEGDVVRARLAGVTPDVALGRIEDEPALADVRVRELELVLQERSQLVRLRAVEHRVHAFDHVRSTRCPLLTTHAS